MAKTSEHNADRIYEAADRFRENCLITDGSLLFPGSRVWRPENLESIPRIIGTDRTDRTFLVKLKEQMEGKSQDLHRLMAELLFVYFLFPSNVGEAKKLYVIQEVLKWGKDVLPDDRIRQAFAQGIGSGGSGYNTRRPFELIFLARGALKFKDTPIEERRRLAGNPELFQAMLDTVDDSASRQLRHILLHLLFPDKFERIASGNHKRKILYAFSSLIEEPTENPDKDLFTLRGSLVSLIRDPSLDFYRRPLSSVWYAQDDEDEATGLSMGIVKYKKQIVLYGPPGTGKTFEAKQLAERIIRAHALESLGAREYFQQQAKLEKIVKDNIHVLQLHPAYSYEDFIQGLHIGADNSTKLRLGTLPGLVEAMGKEAEGNRFPHVLILDEMNRTDLSRMLGECFSLLENRGEEVVLPGRDENGHSNTLTIPERLFVIGTMNLIDQSIEQVDFALRRRFLWVSCPFQESSLIAITRVKWENFKTGVGWSKVESDFERLVEAASALNVEIRKSRALGPMYEIGHTYFTDAVAFLREDLLPRPTSKSVYLYDRKGDPRGPLETLWEFSLRPLLEQYLAGLDADARKGEMDRLRMVFLKRSNGPL